MRRVARERNQGGLLARGTEEDHWRKELKRVTNKSLEGSLVGEGREARRDKEAWWREKEPSRKKNTQNIGGSYNSEPSVQSSSSPKI